MKGFAFDLQRFDTQIIPAGETFTADGVTYTAIDDAATLSLDDGKVSGIESGKVQAVVTSAENSPKVTFDASDGAINFTAASDGKVISITPFPIEFIAGEFTYTGNSIAITAGSDLAITTQSGDFILRNENHFDYDSTYTFTSTAMISDAERVISLFRLTNGSDVRQLQLEHLGKVINTFAERGVTLVKGSSEVLNIGDYKLTATAEKADAGLNFELGEAGMTFVPNTGDGTLTVALSRSGKDIFSGELECTNGSITFDYDHAVTFAKDTSFNFTTKNNSVLTVTATDEATTNIALTDNGITFTPGSGDGGLNISLSKKGKQVFEGSLNITDGTITFNPEEKKFSFTDGTKMQLGMWNLEFGIEVVGDTTVGSGIGASFKIDADENGNFIFTPDENGGSFNISLKRDGTTPLQNALLMTDSETDDDAFFENNVTVNGPIMFNPETGLLTLKDGTEIAFTFNENNYTLTATADGDASSTISLTENGISITPEIGDGKLNLTLGSADGSMSADIEILSGGFLFGENGALNVVEGTELQLTFSDEYSVKFKTTDAAGGSLKLVEGGLTFTPNAEDGNLELTVTRGDETRTASLDVTGSITYKLDGSISLAEGTVVKNIFEDGNVLTITANTDASGSIVFHPQNGLTITPSTAEALNVLFTSGDTEVFNITSISGSVNYKGGVITASDGTEVLFTNYYMESEMKLSTSGGSSSLKITEDSTSYIANEGATFVLDYLDGDTLEISNGRFIDNYERAIVTAGAIFKTNDDEDYFYLETAGDYTLNGMKVTTTADNAPVMLSDYKTITVDGISYTALDENVTLTIDDGVTTCAGGKVSMQAEGFSEVFSCDTTDGAISYDGTTNKFSVKSGAKSYLENFSDQFVAKSDFDITVAKNSDGTVTFSTDDSAAFAIERNGTAIISSTMTLDGSIVANPSNNQITVPKDTVLTLTPGDDKKLQITALDDAGGQLTLVEGGIRFAPNENDGALEFNFVNSERKVQLDVTGAFTYKGLGALSLEDGTEATFTWEDGNILKLTSSGSTGSIGIDPDKGLKITSDDENLDITFTTPSMSTDISGIKGTIYYNAGNVSFDENAKITATTTLGGQPILTTLETIDGTGHISFNTTNGVLYSADTGALKVTWSRDDLESTFTVNEGSVQIGHNLFRITEGSDIATDLKNFVPAFYFTTGEAGTYTINGQTITTSAEGLALTATDDQMVFKTSDDVVSYEGMTFAGNGNVSLKPDIVVLGKDVVATGFGEGNSFMLAEAGNVTADAKVFELSSLENKLGEEIPLNVSVEGAEDGFIFSRTITRESEDNFDDPDYDNVGKVFTEKFIVHGDDSYRTRTDPIGLEEVIGISKDSTIEGGATLGDEVSPSYYDLVTDTNGKFTIGKNTYTIADDTQVGVVLTARFNGDSVYASAVKNLNGTISGNFSDGGFRVNGNDSLNVYGDTDISIIGGGTNYEIVGLDTNASLQVSAADTYKVNGTEIAAGAQDVIVGTGDGKARLYTLPAALADFMLHKTEAGYPRMAALAFHPDEEDPDAPTNYYLAEQWTTASTDDLQLSAIHYSPENPTGKWVILVHGYGKKGAAMNAFAEPYLAQGMDVLIVDQRTAGNSEGDWLTMGVAEANDLAIWTQEIAKTNANAQITLHGVSMGAATVMLSAALPETVNVSAIIEDCGYGNIADVFAALMSYYGPSLGVSGVDFYELFDGVAEVAKTLDGGYDVTDAAPLDSIAAVTVPSLFIHGADDGVIPSSVASALYKTSGALNKTRLIVDGAGHAKSIELDADAYFKAVRKLIASSTTEIGALIDSEADNKLLRGTIYNDTINNSGDDVTVNGGNGNDSINSTGENVQFNYTEGDGNDTIYGFNSTDILSISGADFTAHKSGDDVIVTVDKGNITLADAASLSSTLNIIDKNGVTSNVIINATNNTNVFGTPNDDYIINSGTAVTVEALGGNDYIENNVDSSLVAAELGNLIDGGTGNDTLYSYHTYNPTLLGGAGNDSVVVSHGHLTYVDGGEGNDTILGIAPDDGEHEDNWGMGGHATVLGGNGNDYIDVGYSNDSSIDGGAGNDTIIGSGKNATISGGDGKNLVKITNVVEDAGEYIVFSGDTTVQGFKTGFGEGSDTIYIPGDPAAVDFKAGGLTFYGDNDSLTLSNVNTTAKVNLFHEKRDVLNKGVFIAEGDWYKVKDSDLTVNAGEEVYFVGPSASPKRGVDFSGISSDLNVTVDTAYVDSEDYVPTTMWINGVYSIKGGAGLTTITGSDKSDTIINGAGNTTIDAKGGDDLISLTSGAALIEYAIGDGNDSIVGFNANSTLSISGGKYSTSNSGNDLVLTVGDEAITIFGASSANVIGERNVPVEELAEMFGDKLTVAENTSRVELSDDGAAVAVYDEDSAVEILGGKGNDTLIALGSAPITFDMSAGGADKIALVTANQKITLEGYDSKQGGGIATGNPNIASMVEEIMAGEDTRFGNGKIIIKTSEETQSLFTLAENASLKGSAIINFFDAHNRILPVGFTNQLGGSIDVSNSSDNYLLLGNYFGEKSGGSTLLSGSGNDTLLGGGGDLLDGGDGRNYIGLSETNDEGATIILSGGKNTVDNFNATFDDGDRISVDAANFDLKFDGENVNVKSDKAKAVLQNISSDDGAARILTVMNGDEIKAAIAQENGTITVGDDAADLYVGNKSGVDFTGFEDTLSADLSDAEHFRGINRLAAGDGISTLIGDSARNTLIAGTNDTSIWSGAGRDFMQGNSSADKSGSTSFLFLEGDGRDTVGNFEFLTEENFFTADKIDTGDYDIKDAFVAGDRVVVKLYDDSCLLINDAVGKDFRINDLIAKVDKNISYDGLANCYVAAGGSSLTVDSSVSSAEIWLDNSHDTTFIGNIRTLDASAVKGNTSLVGNEFDNTIIAGQGDSSLWGGSSTSNDVLIGGAGKNSFFYLQGNGRDTVQSVKDGDEIILDNINLDQILDANISAAGVNLNFTDGGSLTINGTADVTYQLADGSKYSANHESLEWVSK